MCARTHTHSRTHTWTHSCALAVCTMSCPGQASSLRGFAVALHLCWAPKIFVSVVAHCLHWLQEIYCCTGVLQLKIFPDTAYLTSWRMLLVLCQFRAEFLLKTTEYPWLQWRLADTFMFCKLRAKLFLLQPTLTHGECCYHVSLEQSSCCSLPNTLVLENANTIVFCKLRAELFLFQPTLTVAVTTGFIKNAETLVFYKLRVELFLLQPTLTLWGMLLPWCSVN